MLRHSIRRLNTSILAPISHIPSSFPLLSVRSLSTAAVKEIDLPALRKERRDDISNLSEVIQRNKFLDGIRCGNLPNYPNPARKLSAVERFTNSGMSKAQVKEALWAGMATFALHVEARIASSLGCGFYTIGPCGEELLAAVGCVLRDTDASALHYRHVATAVSRQSRHKALGSIILDRARGYTCSSLDPVTGGKHCAIGGTDYDFVVSSTLASQAPPAVGRALGISLSNTLLKLPASKQKQGSGSASNVPATLPFPPDAVSYVSVGDGSVNNAHFLAALNLAEYAQHRKFKCPIVFGISNNDICISLRNYGWLPTFLRKYEQGSGMKVFQCDGSDMFDVYRAAATAFAYSRSLGRPCIIVYNNITRRFGHAATDRQGAYLKLAEIDAAANRDVLLEAVGDAVAVGATTFEEVYHEMIAMIDTVERSFNQAVNEPKISSNDMLVASNEAPTIPNERHPTSSPIVDAVIANRNRRSFHPIAPVTMTSPESLVLQKQIHAEKMKNEDREVSNIPKKPPQFMFEPMRKHMTRLYDELLQYNNDIIYIGEDVQHGGYYLVTDGLASKYPMRVCDFPPDETTLVGAAMGYAQCGFVPILEIPYAKYLDCASDMFYELVLMHWLTNGKQSNGMIIRLQGFDKGVFGGNFHTHNVITTTPGLDVVCYSNGVDYVRGMRYAVRQARGGRVVMSVDSTDLLNRRHVDIAAKDDGMLSHYPPLLAPPSPFTPVSSEVTTAEDELTFDDIIVYKGGGDDVVPKAKKLIIITYGNGVPTSLLAMKHLLAAHNEVLSPSEVLVVDCPYLSKVPQQLTVLLALLLQSQTKTPPALLFADVCKEGSNMPLNGYIMELQKQGLLPTLWSIVSAAPTYNPLSRTITFLNENDIAANALNLLNKQEQLYGSQSSNGDIVSSNGTQ